MCVTEFSVNRPTPPIFLGPKSVVGGGYENPRRGIVYRGLSPWLLAHVARPPTIARIWMRAVSRRDGTATRLNHLEHDP